MKLFEVIIVILLGFLIYVQGNIYHELKAIHDDRSFRVTEIDNTKEYKIKNFYGDIKWKRDIKKY